MRARGGMLIECTRGEEARGAMSAGGRLSSASARSSKETAACDRSRVRQEPRSCATGAARVCSTHVHALHACECALRMCVLDDAAVILASRGAKRV